MYIVRKYETISLLTNSLAYDDLFEAIHFCIKQGNSCVINLTQMVENHAKEIFVPRIIL